MLLRCKTKVNAAAETVFACVDEPEHIVKWVGGALSGINISQSETRRTPWANGFSRSYGWAGPSASSTERSSPGRSRHISAPAHSDRGLFERGALSDFASRGAERSIVDYSIDVTLHTLTARVLGTLLRVPLRILLRQKSDRQAQGLRRKLAGPPGRMLNMLRGQICFPGARIAEVAPRRQLDLFGRRLAHLSRRRGRSQ